MAYLAYPIAKTKPPYGDIYHDFVPVIVTTVVEYEETVGRRRNEWGGDACQDADPIAVTLGQTRCGVWWEGEVLLDDSGQSADEMIDRFDLNADWLWDWERDYHNPEAPDQAAMQAPHHVR